MGRSDLGTLPAGERVFVDSNILTYHLLNHRVYGTVCKQFMQDVQDDKYYGFEGVGLVPFYSFGAKSCGSSKVNL
jgi:hypothetical protein